MGRAYLLTGDKGVGKTTALKAIVDSIGLTRCGGFYAQEVRDGETRTGFHIITLDGKEGTLADVTSNSSIRVGGLNEIGIPRYGVELDFLENVAIQILRSAITRPDVDFVVLDEIGPMQLFSDKFKQAVLEVMNSPKVLIGTIVLRSHPWTDEFKQRKDVETFLLTFNNRNSLTRMLSWFCQQV